MKGTYILVINVSEDSLLSIGSLGNIKFKEGSYLYVGSALGTGSTSLENRLKRHISNIKKIHWHIDYLLASKVSTLSKIYIIPTPLRLECVIAQEIQKKSELNIKRFGSTDCSCESHLFYFKEFSESILKN